MNINYSLRFVLFISPSITLRMINAIMQYELSQLIFMHFKTVTSLPQHFWCSAYIR